SPAPRSVPSPGSSPGWCGCCCAGGAPDEASACATGPQAPLLRNVPVLAASPARRRRALAHHELGREQHRTAGRDPHPSGARGPAGGPPSPGTGPARGPARRGGAVVGPGGKGPQQTLYVPAPVTGTGTDRLVALEVLATTDAAARFAPGPRWATTTAD